MQHICVWQFVANSICFVVCLTPFHVAHAQSYPPSPVIKEISWAPVDSIKKLAKGCDNFPVTWADDGSLYTTYGDGWGFRPKVAEKLSLGFARVTGGPGDFKGFNIRSPDEQYGGGRAGKKGWGILCVDSVLFLWMGHADNNGGQAQLAWSDDHAKTWTFAEWQFPEFGLIGFVNFGMNYASARDRFVYAYSHDGPLADTPADGFVLMRADKDGLRERKAWEFFAGIDRAGSPRWTADIGSRTHVISRKDSALRSAMTFNAGLGRYLWWQQHPRPEGEPDRGDTRFEGGFSVFDAPQPWGPWTTAFTTSAWDVGPGEHGDFPAKWISPDGRTLHLVFSGDDHFCVRQAKIVLRSNSK